MIKFNMPYVKIWLPDPVHYKWSKDLKHKGLIAKLVANYYGYNVIDRRVVKKPTA